MIDLDKLIDAVGLSAWEHYICPSQDAGLTYKQSWLVDCAYHGSLDAAKALHEALLPGWGSRRTSNSSGNSFSAEVFPGTVGQPRRQEAYGYHSESRAWLLSILKAYRSMK